MAVLRVGSTNLLCGPTAQPVSGAAAGSVWLPPSGRGSGSSDEQPPGNHLHLQPGNLTSDLESAGDTTLTEGEPDLKGFKPTTCLLGGHSVDCYTSLQIKP